MGFRVSYLIEIRGKKFFETTFRAARITVGVGFLGVVARRVGAPVAGSKKVSRDFAAFDLPADGADPDSMAFATEDHRRRPPVGILLFVGEG